MSLQVYTGNCHCGAFRYRFEHEKIASATSCDCSYCSRQGWASIKLNELEILRGELKEYQFGAKFASHRFCGTCGTPVMAVLGDSYYLNIRTIAGIDVWSLDMKWVHYSSHPTSYIPPSAPKHALVANENEKIYTGACHCGDVKVAIRTKPLPEHVVKECNCSICIRNALVLFYPKAGTDDVQIFGEENLLSYSWGRKYTGHRFCKTCGVEVDLELFGPPKEIVDKLQGAGLERYKEMMSIHPVNIRILTGVEWPGEIGQYVADAGDGKIKITREDGTNDGIPYTIDP